MTESILDNGVDLKTNSSMNRRTIAAWVRGSVAIAAVFALAACGKKDNSAAVSDTTAMAAPADTTAAAGSTAASATAAASGGTAAPITGKTIDVKMIGDAKGYRFEPAKFTIKVGDGVRFTNVSGGPHDASFWADSIPAGAATQLQANMPNTMQPLVGPLLVTPNEQYTISFAGLKPGIYHFYCTPHLALGMVGTISVQ